MQTRRPLQPPDLQVDDPYFDPELDLVLQRDVDVARELVWRAWTEPKHFEKWFRPKMTDVVLELKPGGRFSSVIHGPNGERVPNVGCCIEAVPVERLVLVDALVAGYRPAPESFFTLILTMRSLGKDSTRYTCIARHGRPDAKALHEKMGFYEEWGAGLDQMVEVIKKGL